MSRMSVNLVVVCLRMWSVVVTGCGPPSCPVREPVCGTPAKPCVRSWASWEWPSMVARTPWVWLREWARRRSKLQVLSLCVCVCVAGWLSGRPSSKVCFCTCLCLTQLFCCCRCSGYFGIRSLSWHHSHSDARSRGSRWQRYTQTHTNTHTHTMVQWFRCIFWYGNWC